MLLFLLAQAATAAAPLAAEASSQGVTSYPPAYFAAQQPNSAMDMLNRIPGFSFDRGDSVRGFEGAAGNVLIDGQRPSSKSDDLGSVIQRIPASQVERIDVIRGGAPGIDMQGKTVLANIIRKKTGGRRGMFAVSELHTTDGRDMPGIRAEASGGQGKRKWEVSASFGRGLDGGAGDGTGTRTFADGRPTVRTRIEGEGDGFQWVGAGSYETPLFGGELRVNGRLFADNFKEEDNAFLLTAPGGKEESIFTQNTDETELGGRFSRKFGANTDAELVALRQTRNRAVRSIFSASGDISDFGNERETSETIGRGVLKHRFGDSLSVEAGGEMALNTLDSQTRFASNGARITLPAANVQVEEDRSEVFAKGTWRPFKKLTVDGAVRYESSTISSSGDVELTKTLHFLKPRLAVAWAPSETRQLRFRVEREVGQLNFGDFVASANLNTALGVTAGNPDINPEQDWVYEATFEQRFWKTGSAVLTLRHFAITDVIDRGPVFLANGKVFDTPQNIGDGTRDAIILELTLPFDKLGLKGAQLKGEVRKRWTEVTDPTTRRKREISGTHPIDWQATFTHDLPRWNITYGFDAYGGFRESYYRFNTVENFKLHTFVRPFFEWKPKPDWNIRFELPNVTRRNLRDTFYVYPGPRSAGGRPDVDDRNISDTPGGFYVRVRKNFGS